MENTVNPNMLEIDDILRDAFSRFNQNSFKPDELFIFCLLLLANIIANVGQTKTIPEAESLINALKDKVLEHLTTQGWTEFAN